MPVGDVLLIAAAVFAINLLPAFGPPTWAVLVTLGLQLDLPPVPLVATGALAAAAGRLTLAAGARHFRDRLSDERRGHLESLRSAVTDHPAGAVAGLALFAVSPVPSAQMFLAAGVTGVRLLPLTAAFFSGRIVSYSLYVGAATAAERSLGPVMMDALRHPASIALQVLLLAGLVLLVRVNWTDVLERRRRRGKTAAQPRETTLAATAAAGHDHLMSQDHAQPPLHVVIAGGGVAALETALALRALAGERVDLTLLAPGDDLVLRPMLVGEPFARGSVTRRSMTDIAQDVGARLVRGSLDAVDTTGRRIRTTEGALLDYDALVVAAGARPVPTPLDGLTFTSAGGRDALCGVLRDLEQGYERRIAFVVPAGPTWALPMYELALMTAQQVWGMCIDDLDVHVVTPESDPLGQYGRAPAAEVRRILDEAGIHLHCGSTATQTQDGTLVLQPSGERLGRIRVVTLPGLEGPRIDGLPADAGGFVPVDDFCRVEGHEDVFVAGDAATFPFKQGGLATQQADVVAHVIAARAGADVEPQPFRPVLRGTLLTGAEDLHLHSTARGAGAVSEQRPWSHAGKVVGTYLTPYLAGDHGATLSVRY